MWEVIRRNQRNSWYLILGMGVLLLALGYSIGFYIEGEEGGQAGIAIALILWAGLWVLSIYQGENMLLFGTGATKISKVDAPRLHNVAEEMTLASGLSKVPSIYVIDDPMPNAFALGTDPEEGSIAVTTGLMKILNRDELQGVIAHEIAHLKNLDSRFMTIAAVMVGTITLMSDFFWRYLWYGGRGKGGRSRRSSSSSDSADKLQLIMFVAAILLAILAPICARLLYLACSRKREFLADASAAVYTRYPDGLACALEKLSQRTPSQKLTNKTLAPLFIVNPLQSSAMGFFSTHPPTDQRIKVLRSMGGGAGYLDYERAYRQVVKEKSELIGTRTRTEAAKVGIRAPSPEEAPQQDAVERGKEVGRFLDTFSRDVVAIPCACGVTLKAPLGLPGAMVTCPKCGTSHDLPEGRSGFPLQKPKPLPTESPAGRNRKDDKMPKTVNCTCGASFQVIPAFDGPEVRCKKCGRVHVM